MIRCFQLKMIVFDSFYDKPNNIGQTTVTFPPFFKRMKNLTRHNKLPSVFIKHFNDDLLDLRLRNGVALTNQHRTSDHVVTVARYTRKIYDATNIDIV